MIVACQTCNKEIEAERKSRKFCDDCRKDRKQAVTDRTYPQWYKEKGVKYHQQWRERHPEWSEANRERSKRRQKDNPAEKKRHDALYYQRHKEQVKANVKAYQQESREKLRPYKHAALVRYRSKLAKADGNWTAKQFKELCEQVDNHCAYCHGKFDKLTADHILPLARGGSNDISNIIPACGSCNYSKQDKTPLEYLTRFRF